MRCRVRRSEFRNDEFELRSIEFLQFKVQMKRRAIVGVLTGLTVAGAFVALATAAEEAGRTPKSQWEGAYTDAQAHRGETLYGQYCLVCHGPDLMGGETAPPLVGGQFQSNWNELSLDDLFERIRTSMPLNAPGTLSKEQTADVLSFVLSKGGYPSGKGELSTRADLLKETKFLSLKP